jgi:hypothetical protein
MMRTVWIRIALLPAVRPFILTGFSFQEKSFCYYRVSRFPKNRKQTEKRGSVSYLTEPRFLRLQASHTAG